MTGTATPDWNALAAAVRQRREELGLRQADLEARGGPTNGTVRNIEQAARTKYARRTYTQLEQALEWAPGVAERVLQGAATAEEIAGVYGPASEHGGKFTPDSGRVVEGRFAPRPIAVLHGDEVGAAILKLLGHLGAENRPPLTETEAEVFDALTRWFRERTIGGSSRSRPR